MMSTSGHVQEHFQVALKKVQTSLLLHNILGNVSENSQVEFFFEHLFLARISMVIIDGRERPMFAKMSLKLFIYISQICMPSLFLIIQVSI